MTFVDQTFTFANGYRASVTQDPRDPSKREIAVLNAAGEFVYDTPITQDVLPGVDPLAVGDVLDRIASLPDRPADAPSGAASRPGTR